MPRRLRLSTMAVAAFTAAAVFTCAPQAQAGHKPKAAPTPTATPTVTPTPTATPTATAQPVASTPGRLGVYSGTGSTGGAAAVGTFASWLGSPVPVATDYIDPFGTYYPTQLGAWKDTGRRLALGLPLVPNGGTFAAVASGTYDSVWKGVAANLVANGLADTVVRVGYEGNNCGIGPWQACDDPAGYAAAFRHVVEVMRTVPGRHFMFDFDSATGFPTGRKLTGYADYYPGDAWVDVIGQNFYDVWWGHQTATPQDRWSHLVDQPGGLAAHKAFAAAHGKPVAFDEWGLYAHNGDSYAGGGDNPYFIDQAAAWFNASGPLFHSYFNQDWGGATLDAFPNGKAEYRVKFGSL